MKAFFRACGRAVVALLRQKTRRRLACLCVLVILAFADFLLLGLVRRTFVFYSIGNQKPVAEDRMVAKTGSREHDIKRYVEEALLGPVSLDTAPLFPRGTRLASLLYRDGVVYADLSETAALGAPDGPGVFAALSELCGGIKRNFFYVQEVRLFIAGHEAYPEKFRGLFGSYADI